MVQRPRCWVAAILLLGLVSGGLYWKVPVVFGRSGTTSEATPNRLENRGASSEQSAEDVQVPTMAPTNEGAADKSLTLSKALEQRPPVVPDLQDDFRSDPARHARYAMRAARAERLNVRLRKRIQDLEVRLPNAGDEERNAIEADLLQLRANLARREELERAAIPTPSTRSGL